jgi:hypothetical protein
MSQRQPVITLEAMIKLLIPLVVLAHGIGHILFLVPAVGLANWADQNGHSWLLTPLAGDGLTRALAAVVWTTVIVLFVGAVVGFLTGSDWWRIAAIAGAAISAVGIVVMWDGLTMGSAAAALVFDVIVLIALLWANWPTTEVVGP